MIEVDDTPVTVIMQVGQVRGVNFTQTIPVGTYFDELPVSLDYTSILNLVLV